MGVRIALAAAIVALAVAGCDGGDPSPTSVPTQGAPSASTEVTSPPPTTTPTTPAASPSPTPPPLPAAARQDTPTGAESFARHWLTTLDYATTSGDTASLRSLGRCASCVALADAIETLYSSGGKAEGGKLTVTDSSVAQYVAGKAALIRVEYDQAAGREIPANGSPKTTPAERGLAFVFTLDREGSSWTLIKLQTLKAN